MVEIRDQRSGISGIRDQDQGSGIRDQGSGRISETISKDLACPDP